MIDTVRLTTTAKQDDEQLHWHWQERQDKRPRRDTYKTYFYNPDDGVPVRATYRPESRQGRDQFLLEFSMPRILYGHNWQLIPDIPAAIVAADDLIKALDALPDLPSTAEMSLSRLDICYNHEVADLLPYYIQALARLDYPHRTTCQFNAQTVEFRAKSVKCKFYDKCAESKGEAPPGLLRHEITMHRARQIKKALRFDKPVTLADLNFPMLQQQLETDLQRLGIFDKPFVSVNLAAERLVADYGPGRGGYRFTILSMYQDLQRAQICDQLHISRNTLNRYLSDIRKAGLPLALSDADHPLPPLRVVL
jgi:hypothetical protein